MELSAEPLAVTALLLFCTALYFSFFRGRPGPPLPGAFSPFGSVPLADGDFGSADDENLRDMCRSFAAGGMYIVGPGDGPPTVAEPPADMPSGVESAALQKQRAHFVAAVEERRGEALSPSEVARLTAHLTVNPALCVLASVGVLPSLLQNRFVAKLGPEGELFALTVGYVGNPLPGGPPNAKHAPHVLAVASPDLRDECLRDGDGLECTVSYAVRATRHGRIETELALVPELVRVNPHGRADALPR